MKVDVPAVRQMIDMVIPRQQSIARQWMIELCDEVEKLRGEVESDEVYKLRCEVERLCLERAALLIHVTRETAAVGIVSGEPQERITAMLEMIRQLKAQR